MSKAIAKKPTILHAIPGRIRMHVPGWSEQEKRHLENQFSRANGVRHVQANPLTGNVAISFDPTLTNERTLLQAAQALDLDTITAQTTSILPFVPREKKRRTRRVRIPVRGMDRDPHVAKRVVERLKHFHGVHAVSPRPLTGRILVEFDEHEANIEDLVTEIALLELPPLPDEDRPAYPLDPGPLIQSEVRTIGAALGLGLHAFFRLAGFTAPHPRVEMALQAAGVIGTLQTLPPVREGLGRRLGRPIADLLLSIPDIIALTLAGSFPGLITAEAEALRLLTEVRARQAAWRRYEAKYHHSPLLQPDTPVHFHAGERTALKALVIEGTGTAIGCDGMPLPAMPGGAVPPGARLYGGPFVLKFLPEESFQAFTPQPRPAPIAPSLYEYYHRSASLLSLICAGVTGLLTLSFSQFLVALLLLTPRSATIGQDNADLSAAARVIRSGAIIVGTRIQQLLRLPSLLLLDGTRLLSDGLEISAFLPIAEHASPTEILARAADVAAATRFPWGRIFNAEEGEAITGGSFDGKVATATVAGVQYTLGFAGNDEYIPEAAHLRQSGHALLLFRSEHEDRPLAVFAVRPRLAPGIECLVQICQRSGVELSVLSTGDQLVERDLALRAHITLLEQHDAVEAIHTSQKKGDLVAFVSDCASAAPGFSACDLAIGLSGDHHPFPTRVDLLAPDPNALAAIIEACARREAATRDSVVISAISNLLGVLLGFRGMIGIEKVTRIVFTSALAAIADGWWRLRGRMPS